jgi:hypothetical protein
LGEPSLKTQVCFNSNAGGGLWNRPCAITGMISEKVPLVTPGDPYCEYLPS